MILEVRLHDWFLLLDIPGLGICILIAIHVSLFYWSHSGNVFMRRSSSALIGKYLHRASCLSCNASVRIPL